MVCTYQTCWKHIYLLKTYTLAKLYQKIDDKHGTDLGEL